MDNLIITGIFVGVLEIIFITIYTILILKKNK